MLLSLMPLLVVEVTKFYEVGNNIGYFLSRFFIILFAAMFLYATFRYAKR